MSKLRIALFLMAGLLAACGDEAAQPEGTTADTGLTADRAIEAAKAFFELAGKEDAAALRDLLAIDYIATQAYGADYAGLGAADKATARGLVKQILVPETRHDRRAFARVELIGPKAGDLVEGKRRVTMKVRDPEEGHTHPVEIVTMLVGDTVKVGDVFIGEDKRSGMAASLKLKNDKGSLVSRLRVRRVRRSPEVIESMDNIRAIVTLIISRTIERGWKSVPYGGKNFVLSIVGHGQISSDNPKSLRILFSPGDKSRSLDKVDIARYAKITKKDLRSGAIDFSELTSYAGRRNGDRDFRITADDESRGVPIIADTSFKGIVILGYSNGAVYVKTYEELGMVEPEDGEPILGDDATNDDLAALSDL